MAITAEQYEAAIPECCEYHTLEEHENGLLLCWGLRADVEAGKPMDCKGCELATRQVSNAEAVRRGAAGGASELKR